MRASAAAINFADLPPLGAPQAPVVRAAARHLSRAATSRSSSSPTACARSSGRPRTSPAAPPCGCASAAAAGASPDEEAAYIQLGQGRADQRGHRPARAERARLARHRPQARPVDSRIDDGTFVLRGAYPRERRRRPDLPVRRQARHAAVGRRADRARQGAQPLLAYDSATTADPNGVIGRDLDWLLHDRDPRYATPTPDQIRRDDARGLQGRSGRGCSRKARSRCDVFGDIDPRRPLDSRCRAPSARCRRASRSPAEVLARPISFPAPTAAPVVLNHRGEAGPGRGGNRLAERGGGSAEAAAEPQARPAVARSSPTACSMRCASVRGRATRRSWARTGRSTSRQRRQHPGARRSCRPSRCRAFFEAADKIAADLAATGPTADEIDRVTEPMLQLLNAAQTGHGFWTAASSKARPSTATGSPTAHADGRLYEDHAARRCRRSPARLPACGDRASTGHCGCCRSRRRAACAGAAFRRHPAARLASRDETIIET